MRNASPDPVAALDAVPIEQVPAAIARLAARLLVEPPTQQHRATRPVTTSLHMVAPDEARARHLPAPQRAARRRGLRQRPPHAEASPAGRLKFAALTACRRAYVFSLTWSQVDFGKRTVTAPSGTTKNGEPIVTPFVHRSRLAALLREQERRTCIAIGDDAWHVLSSRTPVRRCRTSGVCRCTQRRARGREES